MTITAADITENDPTFFCPLIGLYPCERKRRGCYCHELHLINIELQERRGQAKMIAAHCWEDGPTMEDGCGTTCMLPDGHEGPHRWTRDDEVRVTFSADNQPKQERK